MFTLQTEDEEARVGDLVTPHGSVTTPFFMPVATRAVGKFVSSDDYYQTKCRAIITNAYLLSLEPGIEMFQKIGSVHQFMNFNGVIFTDCGGFQMLRQSLLLEIKQNGIVFKYPFGKKTFLGPEECINIGRTVGGDVIMALDCVLPYGKIREEYIHAIARSHRWTKKCRDLYTGDQMLFGITQGGTFDDIRIGSAKAINAMGFDGHALGGLAIGESPDLMYHCIEISVPHLDKKKPRYVMGVGKPDQILECVARGVDIFDSIYPQRAARHGQLFTWKGIVDIGKKETKYQNTPIDETCSCLTCHSFSRAYLRYLLKRNDPVGKRYLTIHNLFFMQELMQKAQENIRNGTFKSFLENFKIIHKKRAML